MVSTYRPRITRELRDTVLEVGETLNGEEPNNYQDALEMLVRYFGVLQHRVVCPECGEPDIEDFENGRYHCWRCEEDQESGHFTVWDYLGVEDEEQASLPGLPSHIQYRFECNHEEHSSGSKDEKSSQNADTQQGQSLNSHQNQWDSGF